MTRPLTASGARLSVTCSAHFTEWLHHAGLSIAVTTCKANRLFLIGSGDGSRLSVFERFFDHATGIYATPERLVLATRNQLWQLDNALATDATHAGYDRLYVPRIGYTTGEIDIHDVAVGTNNRMFFVNTLYSCLATVSDKYNFTPVWQPAFISSLAPEDRCHLNGLAMSNGEPRYVTSIARSDVAGGWREQRHKGGCVIDVPSGEIVAHSLSMPHSPRIYRGQLWLLNSGSGELGRVDPASGRFEAVAACPGYLRGLAFHDSLAVVALSKPRYNTLYSGLSLDERLESSGTEACCGIRVIDLNTGTTLHSLDFNNVVTELYDVQMLTGVQRPMALGLKSDDMNRIISFENNGSKAVHTLMVAAGPGEDEVPRETRLDQIPDTDCTYQHSLDMSLEFALSRLETLTFPRLGKQAGGGEIDGPLAAVIAAQQGQPIGLVLAAYSETSGTARVISWFVTPGHRRKGVGSELLRRLEGVLARAGRTRLELNFRADWANVAGIENILQQLGWSVPQASMLLFKGTMQDIAQADWLDRCHLPAGFEIFPWSDLTTAERRIILDRQHDEQWYPPELTPFQEEDRIEFLNSLGLRHQGQVVGWMITHRTAPDTIQYTSLFVRQDLQPLGRALALLAAAIKRQMQSDVPRGICQVRPRSDRMARYMHRRFLPFDISETDQRSSYKDLDGKQETGPVRRIA